MEKQVMYKERIRWIDILKGMGMVLVVWAHANFRFANADQTSLIQKHLLINCFTLKEKLFGMNLYGFLYVYSLLN